MTAKMSPFIPWVRLNRVHGHFMGTRRLLDASARPQPGVRDRVSATAGPRPQWMPIDDHAAARDWIARTIPRSVRKRGAMRVFGLHLTQPSARRVYQPAALP